MEANGRFYRRARAALLVVEVLHYLLGVCALGVGAVVFLPGVIELLGRVGRAGVVAWRNIDQSLTGLAIIAYACFT